MVMRSLGRTGLEVSGLSLGAAFVTRGEDGPSGSTAIIGEALDAGINLIDTSADYGDSEAAVGKALRGEKRRVIISTKIGPRSKNFDPKNEKQLRKCVETSLRLLHRDVIDILMIHEPDRPGQIDWWEDLRNFRGPVIDTMNRLKDSGVIRFIGLGGTTAYEIVPIIATGAFDVVLSAFNYSLLWREAGIELIPEAKREGMGIMLGSPTQQGWLAHRWDEKIEKANSRWLNKPRREQFKELYRLVDESGIPVPELALRWALMNPDASTVLTGPRTLDQLRQNVKAAETGPLPEDLVRRLDGIAAKVPFRPHEEPFGCPFRDTQFDLAKRPGYAFR
ncbi:MAG: aldo/keto reductase [Rectinemataceae bacterium]|jgi:aryl-alcohol dehydrogenase-like predicted oxidoreductase